jgi:flagellar FliL protein
MLKLIAIALMTFASFALAEEEELVDVSSYFDVEPPFVTNFGGPGRLKYMKVQITLRVKGVPGEQQATHHLPRIRDSLLTLFSVQTSDSIEGAEGKEVLRKKALAQVNSALSEEDDESLVEDLLFTSFVAHH